MLVLLWRQNRMSNIVSFDDILLYYHALVWHGHGEPKRHWTARCLSLAPSNDWKKKCRKCRRKWFGSVGMITSFICSLCDKFKVGVRVCRAFEGHINLDNDYKDNRILTSRMKRSSCHLCNTVLASSAAPTGLIYLLNMQISVRFLLHF